jgi:hypothetical protein
VEIVKDVSEKLRLAVVTAIKKWDGENENRSRFLKFIGSPDSQARNFLDDAVAPILAELDELAEIKRLLKATSPKDDKHARMEIWTSGHGWISDIHRRVRFGPGERLPGPLEALRSLLPPPETVTADAPTTIVDVGVFNGMKFTLTVTPEEK